MPSWWLVGWSTTVSARGQSRRGDDCRLELHEVFLGLAAMGGVCVPIDVLLTAPEIAQVCGDSGSTVLVLDEIATASVAGPFEPFELFVTPWRFPGVIADLGTVEEI